VLFLPEKSNPGAPKATSPKVFPSKLPGLIEVEKLSFRFSPIKVASALEVARSTSSKRELLP